MGEALKILNTTTALDSCAGNSALACKSLHRLLAFLPDARSRLEAALRAEQWDAVRDVAHRLQSASRYLGAERLASAAKHLEEQVTNPALKSEIVTPFTNLLQEIQILLDQPEDALVLR